MNIGKWVFSISAELLCLVPFVWTRRLYRGPTIFPFYHAVSDKSLPHIEYLYPIRSIAEFKKDLDFLQRHYEPIRLGEEWDSFQLRKGKKQRMLLSFDDGLRECHQHIAPILEHRNIQAVFFVNSGFIDNEDLFYRYKLSIIWGKLKDFSKYDMAVSQIMKKLEINKAKEIPKRLMSLQHEESELIDELASLLNISFADYLENEQPYMTTEQLKDLKKRGFLIGAHSEDHPLYYKLSEQEILRQTKVSCETIKAFFPEEKILFSFPFTDYGVGSKLVRKMKQERLFDFCFGCAGLRKEKESYHIQRIPMESGHHKARAILSLQMIKFAILNMMGRARIQREKWN